MAAIPKKEPGSVRLIHNLSFPKDASVNSHIESQFGYVQYETIDTCVDIILKLGNSTLVAKSDLESAYNVVNIHRDDFKFWGFFWNNYFFFQKTLPMGSSISCKEFEVLSSAVHWILVTKLHVPYVSHILDDFIFLDQLVLMCVISH